MDDRRRGNLKGDLMGALIGPGDLAAEGVDRTAWRWSEVPQLEGHRCWKQFKHTPVKVSLRDARCSVHVVCHRVPSEDVEMQTRDYPGG